MSEHARAELRKLIEERFRDVDGTKWTQERIGEALGGLSQGYISDLVSEKKKKEVGPSLLLSMSRHTERTINALLGPTAPVSDDVNLPLMIEKVRALLRVMTEWQGSFGTSGKFAQIPILLKELQLIIPREKTPEELHREQIRETAKISPLGKKKKKQRLAASDPTTAMVAQVATTSKKRRAV